MKTRPAFRKLNEEEVTIRLDKYEDMFSDFDNRTFHTRMLSGDLLDEIQKIVQELPKKSKIVFKFLVKEFPRNRYDESVILQNLMNHYKHHNEEIYSETKESIHKGYLFTIVGFLIISIPVLLSVLARIDSFSNHCYLMVEPFGWFLAFTGLDKLFQSSRTSQKTLKFNKRMLDSKFVFCGSDQADEEKNESFSPLPASQRKFDHCLNYSPLTFGPVHTL